MVEAENRKQPQNNRQDKEAAWFYKSFLIKQGKNGGPHQQEQRDKGKNGAVGKEFFILFRIENYLSTTPFFLHLFAPNKIGEVIMACIRKGIGGHFHSNEWIYQLFPLIPSSSSLCCCSSPTFFFVHVDSTIQSTDFSGGKKGAPLLPAEELVKSAFSYQILKQVNPCWDERLHVKPNTEQRRINILIWQHCPRSMTKDKPAAPTLALRVLMVGMVQPFRGRKATHFITGGFSSDLSIHNACQATEQGDKVASTPLPWGTHTALYVPPSVPYSSHVPSQSVSAIYKVVATYTRYN